MNIIENKTFDEERALYGSKNLTVRDCRFDGPADGESAFKECENVAVNKCFFNLRYPFWHDDGLKLSNSELTELCRAALWYSKNIDTVYENAARINRPSAAVTTAPIINISTVILPLKTIHRRNSSRYIFPSSPRYVLLNQHHDISTMPHTCRCHFLTTIAPCRQNFLCGNLS